MIEEMLGKILKVAKPLPPFHPVFYRVAVEEGKEREVAKQIATVLGTYKYNCGDSFAYHAEAFGIIWHIYWGNCREVLIYPCILDQMHELEDEENE